MIALGLMATIGYVVVTGLLPIMGVDVFAADAETPSASASVRPTATPHERATATPHAARTPRPTPRATPEPTSDPDAIARARSGPLMLRNQAVGDCLMVMAVSARYETAIPSGGFSVEATPGYKFAMVAVVAENLCTASVYTNPFDFTLVTADGLTVNHDSSMYALDALTFEGGNVYPQTSVSGLLVFEIRTGDAPVRLVMDSFTDHVEVDLLQGVPSG